jgi:hypothetical protein
VEVMYPLLLSDKAFVDVMVETNCAGRREGATGYCLLGCSFISIATACMVEEERLYSKLWKKILNQTQPCPQIIVAVHVVAILACALRDLAPAAFFRLLICFTVVVACATILLPDHAIPCQAMPCQAMPMQTIHMPVVCSFCTCKAQ